MATANRDIRFAVAIGTTVFMHHHGLRDILKNDIRQINVQRGITPGSRDAAFGIRRERPSLLSRRRCPFLVDKPANNKPANSLRTKSISSIMSASPTPRQPISGEYAPSRGNLPGIRRLDTVEDVRQVLLALKNTYNRQ